MAEFQTFSLADSLGKAQGILASRQAMDNRTELMQAEREERDMRAKKQQLELFGKLSAGIASQFDSLPEDQRTDENFNAIVQKHARALEPFDPVSAQKMMGGIDKNAMYSLARSLGGYTPQSELLKAKQDELTMQEKAKQPYELERIREQGNINYGNQSGMAALNHDYALKLEEMRNRNQLGQDAAKGAQQAELEKLKEAGKIGEQSTGLRKEFDSLQQVKDWRTIEPTIRSAIAAAKVPNKAADLDLVYAFAKLMDPGSVVREGEMAMVKDAASFYQKVASLISRAQGKNGIPDETRQELLNQLIHRANEARRMYDAEYDRYGKLADTDGIPRERLGLTPSADFMPQQPPSIQQTPDGKFSVTVQGKPQIFSTQAKAQKFLQAIGGQ